MMPRCVPLCPGDYSAWDHQEEPGGPLRHDMDLVIIGTRLDGDGQVWVWSLGRHALERLPWQSLEELARRVVSCPEARFRAMAHPAAAGAAQWCPAAALEQLQAWFQATVAYGGLSRHHGPHCVKREPSLWSIGAQWVGAPAVYRLLPMVASVCPGVSGGRGRCPGGEAPSIGD